ncbi:MAG: hypothetical protein OEY47_02380 [Candidatus Bathyarchaeota archaeon]|nr:hypothetical protein [Candidatus Bathyarchaeota archaeon]
MANKRILLENFLLEDPRLNVENHGIKQVRIHAISRCYYPITKKKVLNIIKRRRYPRAHYDQACRNDEQICRNQFSIRCRIARSWKKVRIYAIENGINMKALIETLLKMELGEKREGVEGK